MSIRSDNSPQYLRGMDISEYQPVVDWAKVAASGIRFCFLRVSHGMHLDKSLASHRQGAKSVRIPRGFYHYFVPTQSVDDQVKLFVSNVGRLERGDLPPVLDIENPPIWSSIPKSQRLALVTRWLTAVEKALGVRPLIYCSRNFVAETLDDPAVDISILSKYPLWLAAWRVPAGQTPKVPAPWSDWVFWQFSDSTRVPGIETGPVDGDVFNGTTQVLGRIKAKGSERTRQRRR